MKGKQNNAGLYYLTLVGLHYLIAKGFSRLDTYPRDARIHLSLQSEVLEARIPNTTADFCSSIVRQFQWNSIQKTIFFSLYILQIIKYGIIIIDN